MFSILKYYILYSADYEHFMERCSANNGSNNAWFSIPIMPIHIHNTISFLVMSSWFPPSSPYSSLT